MIDIRPRLREGWDLIEGWDYCEGWDGIGDIHSSDKLPKP